MTRAEEIAKNIADVFCLPKENHLQPCPMQEYIASKITKAVEEAVKENTRNMNHTSRSVHSCKKGMEIARAEGKREGIEEAANVSGEICPDENFGEDCHFSITRRIRALLPPPAGQGESKK